MMSSVHPPTTYSDNDGPEILPVTVPRAKNGFIVYTQVAIDLAERYGLSESQQAKLNDAMLSDISSGRLRTFDASRRGPTTSGNPSPYVHPRDVQDWLKANHYEFKWGPDTENPATVSEKRKRMPNDIERLIKRENELKIAGVRDYAARAAREENIDPSAARKEKAKYRANQIALADPFTNPFKINQPKVGKKVGKA
jgi:hypothetical protein